MPDVSTIRVILPQNQVVSINAGTVLPSPGFSLNGTSISVSLVAGNNISLSSHLSTITIAGAAAQAFTLNGSTGSASLIAGNNITLQSNNSSITIIGASAAGAAFTLNASTGSVSLVAGANITFNSGASSITLVGPTVPTATNFSLNGSSSSVSLVAGANIGFASGASSVTISATNQTSSLSYVAAIGTAGALSTGSIALVAGANITLNTGASSITIIGPTPGAGGATQSFSGGGTSITGTAISVALFGGNNVSLASASGAGSLSLTVNASSNALNNVSLLNASSGALSISAGAGIGIGQANSTITVSASVQTVNQSLSASGNTTGATSSGTYANVLAFSGMGAISVGAGNGTVSISAPAAGAAFSTISLSASGNTTGATSSGTMNNVLAFSGMGNVSIGAGNGTISISGGAAAAGTVSLTALGNTTSSSSGTYSGLLNVSGAGGVSIGAGAQSLTISGPSQTSLVPGVGIGMTSAGSTITVAASVTTLVAGANISLTSGGSSITIIGTGPSISLTQNVDLGLVAGTIVSKGGTITGTAGVGSSLFIERVRIPAVMSISEIDAAMSLAFPATNQGAGTMSRSFVLYSFGNSTSLASVMSTSGSSVWSTGTSTTAGATSLTQFQGGWSSPMIQPFTFASSSVSPGDYVVGQLFNFAQASSTWTLNLYGAQAVSSFLASAATNLTSATIGAVSANTAAASGITGMSSYGSAFVAGSFISALSSMALSTNFDMSSSSTGGTVPRLSFSSTATNKTVTFGMAWQSSNTNILSSLGTVAGSIINGLTTLGAVTNVALGALNSSTLAQIGLPNFGFIGTGSTTSGFPYYFSNGIMSTGAVPTAITLTSTAVTFSGSAAFQQPWLALVGL